MIREFPAVRFRFLDAPWLCYRVFHFYKEGSNMKQFFSAVVVVSLMAALHTTCTTIESADQEENRFFIGLWEGVDPLDGSSFQVSISDIDRNGVIDTISRETFFTLCDGERGLATGTGTVGDDGILRTNAVLTCLTTGKTISGESTYEPVKKDEILVLSFPRTNPDLPPIILHQVSSRL